MVDMTHPNLPGQTYRATESQAKVMRRSGWVAAGETPPLAVSSDGPAKLDSAPARKRAAEAEKENS